MKILLTGCAGQLGRELKRSLACLGEVIACDRRQLDLADPIRCARRCAPSRRR
jgi:dTDP-4-dehydrorhamnose reductase